MSTFVTSLPNETNPQVPFRTKVQWDDNSFRLTIINGASAYTAEATRNYIAEQSKDLQLPENTYLSDCQSALSLVSNDFTFSMSDGFFHLKKQLSTRPIKAKFASLKLTQVPQVEFPTTVLELVDALVSEKATHMKDIQKLRMENESLVAGTASVTKHLKELQDEKNHMEKDLYRRFLCLLNTKKNKIKNLKSQLHMSGDSDSEASAGEGPSKMETNEEENVCGDAVYDADTDIDDDIPLKDDKSTVSEVKEILNDVKIESTTETEEKKPFISSVHNVLSTMTFLDPTIPFFPD